MTSETDTFKTGSTADLLRSFLSRCEKKFMLLTTNIDRPMWPKRFDARVADRLDAAHFFDTTGIPSYRPKLKG
jgi:hypothetical protein